MRIEELISIVIPVYNESDSLVYTVRAIKEIIAKENICCEIILINDGSTDNTWEIIQNIAESGGGN